MTNNETKKLNKALSDLKSGFSAIDEILNEFPLHEDEIGDLLLDDAAETLYPSVAGALFSGLYEASLPAHKLKRLDLSGSLYNANDKALFSLVDFIDGVKTLTDNIQSGKVSDLELENVRNSADRLFEEVLAEMYERIQLYRNDLDKIEAAVDVD